MVYRRSELEKKIGCLVNSNNEEQQLLIYIDLKNNILDPYWSDYIYHSDEFINSDGILDIKSVVDKILKYKPISL